jgi:uncharacterized protein YoxC
MAKPVALLLLVGSVGLAGCGPTRETRQRLADLEQASAQKDSLLLELADLGRFISDVNTELANVTVKGTEYQVTSESPVQATRDSTLMKIRYLTAAVDESEARLEQSRRRIRGLTSKSDSLQTLLAETIRNYEATIETQRTQIADLTARVDTLRTQNERLAAAVDTLSAEMDTLRTEASTVYYVVGTKQELIERGIVQEEGGARRFFIFGRAGKTLVPARDLDPSQFTPIDKYVDTHIPLPDPAAEYRIASRHPIELLANPIEDDGGIRGEIEIAAPEGFWQGSKYLIVVQKS